MKVINDVAWQEQRTELLADGELGQKFLHFFEEWFDRAEKDMLDGANGPDRFFTSKSTVKHHVSKALEVTEQTLGFLPLEWIGQMLIVAIEHWEHGKDMHEGLTFIEHRLIEQELAKKLAELQKGATL